MQLLGGTGGGNGPGDLYSLAIILQEVGERAGVWGGVEPREVLDRLQGGDPHYRPLLSDRPADQQHARCSNSSVAGKHSLLHFALTVYFVRM